MQDIDFDEIDRAVSSTMNPQPAEPQPETVPVTEAPKPRSETPATRRSSGRFMDVVHPSSDMRPASSERSTPRPSEPVREEPASAPAPAAEPAPTSDWPDPLDFHGFTEESAPTIPPAPESPSEVKPESEPTPTPLESPFLSDAKVEKRPLGAFSALEPSVNPLQPSEDAPVSPTEPETPLIEAPDEPRLEDGTAAPETPETPLEIASSEPEKQPEPAPMDEPAAHVPASITQQYKEQPSSADQSTGAIFDTEAYHQPLAHPGKKKSGALIIVWILLLIILGGGIGAAVYFFVLPML